MAITNKRSHFLPLRQDHNRARSAFGYCNNDNMHVNHHRSRSTSLCGLVKCTVTFGIAFTFGQLSNIILNHDTPVVATKSSTLQLQFPLMDPSDPSTEHDERNSFQPTKDPYLETLDCSTLLRSYRRKEVPQLKSHSDEHPYHKCYVRLSSTQIPFYVSTNDAKVDRIRVEVFNSGDYYETAMSSSMQTILEEESKRLKSNNQMKRPIMLDIGGNIGWFSLLAAAYDAEVFVFEPNVVNMVRFCESLVLNQWVSSSNPGANQVHPFMKGVSDEHGAQQKMYKVSPGNPGSFSFSQGMADAAAVLEGEPLQLVTLDALAQDQDWLTTKGDNHVPIAILKIDVEGLELKVLQGAKKLLKSRLVKNIFLELKSDQVREEWVSMFSILMDDAGYELYKFGDHLGPTTSVMATQFRDMTELASIIAEKGFLNSNVWFRLSE
mmetsp:Transcript_1402/g.2560  ORF Transcript_1402/g.2560 Transcript_1402/m.2560 type:complete len:436 (+) Transcript_1402:179-1486(+)